jgi:DNA-binding NarL/FixJ family response regulator
MKAPLKILLVDQSVYSKYQLNEILATQEDQTLIELAEDLEMAEHAIPRFQPNLIITEIDQTEGRPELLQWVKDHAQKAKLMVLTHFTLSCYRDACKKTGADYFFDKASEMLAVKKTIRQLYQQMPL